MRANLYVYIGDDPVNGTDPRGLAGIALSLDVGLGAQIAAFEGLGGIYIGTEGIGHLAALEGTGGVGDYVGIAETLTFYSSLDALRGLTGGTKVVGALGGLLSFSAGSNQDGVVASIGAGVGVGAFAGLGLSHTWITDPVTWGDLWDVFSGNLSECP